MSWYGSLANSVTNAISDGAKIVGLNGYTEEDQGKVNRLNDLGGQGVSFAGDARNNYNQMTGRLNGSLDYLQGQMQGQNSIAAEQLRQGMQQGLNAQRSMAAGAAPQNQAMAARGAVNNMARLNYGLNGQQALAGIQERNAAAQAYGQLAGQMRGQDVQGALGGYGIGINAYTGGLNGSPAPTLIGQLGPLIGAAGSMAMK